MYTYLILSLLEIAFHTLFFITILLQDDIPIPDYVGKLHGGPYLWIALKGHYGKENFA